MHPRVRRRKKNLKNKVPCRTTKNNCPDQQQGPVLIFTGDLNAKLEEVSTKILIGPYSLGERNERRDRLMEEFALENNLAVTKTLLQRLVKN